MYLSQRFLKGLGCLSYLVGDEETGEAAVIDPQLDVEHYLREAEEAGLRIRHVLDTHLHADHVSGNRALAAATGATLHLPARAKAAFPCEPLREGTEVRLGNVVLRARETPGHTPEHVTFEVVDRTRPTDRPYALLTGDTLLVGSVGRPDLVATTGAGDLGGMLFESFRKLLPETPDGTLVYPGHGPGSACGANLGRLLSTTLGYEKETNPYLQEAGRDAFVRRVVTGLPPRPGNAVTIKRINTQGPPLRVPSPTEVQAFAPEALSAEVGDGRSVLVVDTSEPDAWAANHVPGSVNVPYDAVQFANRIGYFLEEDQPVYLVMPEDDPLGEVLLAMARVGGVDVRGYLGGGVAAWRNAGMPFETVPVVSAQTVARELQEGATRVLDVRTRREWEEGHIEGATWAPWEQLTKDVEGLDPDEPWTVVCASGYRSSMAASLLKRAGFPEVANLLGGMTAWEASGGATVPERGGVAPAKPA
ncbi:MAG TPA: rhodanese-like domain-containing protein [Candidatus Thermoplasmatota archaeon]|nr:rhodanese-like domain-containing protein [Candidatus Thermoplasmatota archaeon]